MMRMMMVVVGRQGAATDDDGYNNITLLMTTSNKKRQQATLWQIVHFVCGLEGQVEKRSRVLGQGIAEGANIPDASVHLSGTHHLTENQHRRPVDQWRTYLATSRWDNRAMTTQTGEGTRVHFQKKRGVLTSWPLFVK